jgi:hypothetical protein
VVFEGSYSARGSLLQSSSTGFDSPCIQSQMKESPFTGSLSQFQTLYRLKREITPVSVAPLTVIARSDASIPLNRDDIAAAYDEAGEINTELAQVDHIDTGFRINDGNPPLAAAKMNTSSAPAPPRMRSLPSAPIVTSSPA